MGKMGHYLEEHRHHLDALQYLRPLDFQLQLHEERPNEEKLMQLKLMEEQQHAKQKILIQ